jgi:hypothetical protein
MNQTSQFDPVVEKLLENGRNIKVLESQLQALSAQIFAMKKPFSPTGTTKPKEKRKGRKQKRDTLKESLAGTRTAVPEQAEDKDNEGFYSTVARGMRLQKDDNAATILTKLVSFMEKTREEKLLQRELAHNFEEEDHRKEKIFNEKLLEAIKSIKEKPKAKKTQPRDEKGRFTKQTEAETPKPSGQQTKPATTPATPKTVTPKSTSTATKTIEKAPTAKTATKVVAGTAAVGGISSAAALSIKAESGVSADKAIQKVGQIVPNDPKPGVTSYGIIGMNSGGSVQTFVKDNPQFNLTAKPASKEFDEQWKKASIEQSKEMLAAQLKWYEKYVESPLRKDMQKIVPKQFANDDRVTVYMTDRRTQYGKTMENQAIAYASNADNVTDFIKRMSEFDKANINQAFKTYLSTNPNNAQGLLNRITKRQDYALGLTAKPLDRDNSLSNKLNDSSIENKDAKKPGTPVVIVNNTVNSTNLTTNKQNFVVMPKNSDIKPLYMEVE